MFDLKLGQIICFLVGGWWIVWVGAGVLDKIKALELGLSLVQV